MHRPACWNFSLATSSLCPSKMAMLKLASWWPLHTNRDNANLSSLGLRIARLVLPCILNFIDCSFGCEQHSSFEKIDFIHIVNLINSENKLFNSSSYLLKWTRSRDFKNYFRVFDAKCVFFVWSLMVFKFLYCWVIFKIENNVF